MQQKVATKEEYARRVNVVVEYINNHLGETIDLGTLASLSNFSPFHFHRITKAFLGEPLGTFIMRMRVEAAARLLRYSDKSVQEIAYEVGYEMPSSLSKVFKQFYGISPNDFRNKKNYTVMKPMQINSALNLQERVEEVPSKQVIYIRLTGDYREQDYGRAWMHLWDYLRRHRLFTPQMEALCNGENRSEILSKMADQAGIAHVCVYLSDPKMTATEKQQADICLTVQAEVKPEGPIGVKQLEGGRYAIYRYVGSYEHLGEVYDTIYGKLIFEAGYPFAAKPGYEVYLNDPQCTPPDQLVTEIYVPLA